MPGGVLHVAELGHRRLNDVTRLEDQGRQLAASRGKVLHRVDHELQGRGEHGVSDLLERRGQGVDIRAIERGDEGAIERLVHLGDDAVGLVLDLAHSLDDRLTVGVGRGCAAVDRAGR